MHQAGSQSKLISGLKCFYGECKTIVGLLKGNICYTENEKARGGSAGEKHGRLASVPGRGVTVCNGKSRERRRRKRKSRG